MAGESVSSSSRGIPALTGLRRLEVDAIAEVGAALHMTTSVLSEIISCPTGAGKSQMPPVAWQLPKSVSVWHLNNAAFCDLRSLRFQRGLQHLCHVNGLLAGAVFDLMPAAEPAGDGAARVLTHGGEEPALADLH